MLADLGWPYLSNKRFYCLVLWEYGTVQYPVKITSASWLTHLNPGQQRELNVYRRPVFLVRFGSTPIPFLTPVPAKQRKTEKERQLTDEKGGEGVGE